jgi:hypothetical protein
MATAEIAPVVSAEMLKSGVTLANTEKRQEPFSTLLTVDSGHGKKASEMSVKFTQSPPSITITALVEVPSARPQSVLFGALVHPTLRLRKPIPLNVSVEEGQVVLSWNETEEFAYGTTVGEALDDFSKTLSGLYAELHSPDVRLGADLDRVRRILEDYIEPRRQ